MSSRALFQTVGVALLAVAAPVSSPGQPCTSLEHQEVYCTDPYVGDDNFGISVSLDGGFFVVGAQGHAFSDGQILHGPGAAFVYMRVDTGVPGDRSDDTWNFVQELLPWDFHPVGSMGQCVSISGARIVTDRRNDDLGLGSKSYQTGSAYVYIRNNGLWVPQQKLIASDAAPRERFGYSVSISGDWIAVSSLCEEADSASNPASGFVYLFRVDDQGTPDLSDDVWIEHVKFGHPMGHEWDRFGIEVAIHQDWLVVAAPGSSQFAPELNRGDAYVYYRDGMGTQNDLSDDQWVFQARLTPLDLDTVDGIRRFQFLALDDQRVLVGDSSDGLAEGAGYVFRRDDRGTPQDLSDDQWYQEAKLVSSDRSAGDILGAGVAIKGDLVVLGAPGHDPGGPAISPGAAYVFRYVGGQWVQQQKVIASDANNIQELGRSAAIADGQFIVGAEEDDTAGNNAGSAYIFKIVDDCNQNCIADEDDIATQTSQDCDGNGVPDECEDCNGNGIADACDLANCQPGQDWCQDCNANGILDACDPDCNANGAPDDCDVANCLPGDLTCQDCNANGLPDPCDISSGSSPDCTGDGIPDECITTCTADCECFDMNVCTFDRCVDGTCTHFPTDYADVDHNGTINLLDLFCILNAFSDDYSANCHPLDVDLHGDGPAMSGSSLGVDHRGHAPAMSGSSLGGWDSRRSSNPLSSPASSLNVDHRGHGPIGGGGSPAPCFPNGTINLFDLFAVMDAFADLDPCCGG